MPSPRILYKSCFRILKRQYHILLLMCLFLFSPIMVSADTVAPLKDFAQYSSDRQFIFVMLVHNNDPTTNHEVRIIEQDPMLRQKYAQSGLYRADDSTQPLWTVEWSTRRVDLASDGHHLVRWGPWPTGNDYEELALAFYADGKQLQRYRVIDLVAEPQQLPHSVSHYLWLDDSHFDEHAMTLTLRTLNKESYSFDVQTGQLIEGTLPARHQNLWILLGIAITVLLVLIVLFLIFGSSKLHPLIRADSSEC